MKTVWDYTDLAKAYFKRPNYSGAAIDAMLKICDMKEGKYVCDIGAGVAHLSLELAARDLAVIAIEPNDAMRVLGEQRTKNLSNIEWYEGVGEDTRQPSHKFDLVTFGSSFNVCDAQLAIKETARVLKPNGWFSCMFNNRQLDDPIQSEIEHIIKARIRNYSYGTRRDDQSKIIESSGMFNSAIHISSSIIHTQEIEACVEAWKSHATLARQAGTAFEEIVNDIQAYLNGLSVKGAGGA